MAFSKVFVIFAAAVAMVYAAPQGDIDSTTVAAAKGNCNADEVVSCCSNTNDASSCFDMSSLLLTLPIGTACPGQNQAACCSKTEQTGLINLNLECTQIPIAV